MKVPAQLTGHPFHHRALTFHGFTVVESCTHTTRSQGTMLLEEHMLLYVSKGQNVLTHGTNSYQVGKQEMILLKKATLLEYDKTGDPEEGNTYDSLLFFLKDDFLTEFIKMANLSIHVSPEPVKTVVKPVKDVLRKFFESLIPHFDSPDNMESGLLRLKMLELLYDVAAADKNLLQTVLQARHPVRTDLTEIMETHFASPISIPELAYLSGRSLASFKRDFQAIYNMAPSNWIRNKRLNKAHEAIQSTRLPIADICYTLGFENTSHFSRLFKSHFGYPPSSIRTINPEA